MPDARSPQQEGNGDPERALADLRASTARTDNDMKHAGDAVDRATIGMAIAMGADSAQVLIERQHGVASQKQAIAEAGSELPSTTLPSAPEKKKKKGWQPAQDAATRAKALRDGAPAPPPALERCWDCFEDLPPAGPWDWLSKGSAGERDRPGQPLRRFLTPGPHRNFPTRTCNKIYLLPLGDVTGAPSAATLRDLLSRWFCLEAVAMKPLRAKALASLERDERGSGYGPQIETPSAERLIHSHKPRDAFVVVAYTMEDM